MERKVDSTTEDSTTEEKEEDSTTAVITEERKAERRVATTVAPPDTIPHAKSFVRMLPLLYRTVHTVIKYRVGIELNEFLL